MICDKKFTISQFDRYSLLLTFSAAVWQVYIKTSIYANKFVINHKIIAIDSWSTALLLLNKGKPDFVKFIENVHFNHTQIQKKLNKIRVHCVRLIRNGRARNKANEIIHNFVVLAALAFAHICRSHGRDRRDATRLSIIIGTSNLR